MEQLTLRQSTKIKKILKQQNKTFQSQVQITAHINSDGLNIEIIAQRWFVKFDFLKKLIILLISIKRDIVFM